MSMPFMSRMLATAGVVVAMAAAPGVARAGDVVTVGGGGQGVLDDNGVQSPLRFGIGGSVAADGTAHGRVAFVFEKSFARDWGAVPDVDLIWLGAELTSGFVEEDGSVVFHGEFIEIDISFEDGVVFVEKDTDLTPIFTLVISPDGQSMLLQWCLLPEFPIDVTKGMIRIR